VAGWAVPADATGLAAVPAAGELAAGVAGLATLAAVVDAGAMVALVAAGAVAAGVAATGAGGASNAWGISVAWSLIKVICPSGKVNSVTVFLPSSLPRTMRA
jgi:hypothetical protein